MTNIRVGDIVELTEPVTPVKRVGYRLHWTEVEIESDDLKAIMKSAAGLPIGARNRINEALRRVEVERKGFGGKERVIVRDTEADSLPPGKYMVTAKRIRYTGTYFPPSSGYDPYYGGGWFDSGGLWDRVPVHLLSIERIGGIAFDCGEIAHTDCQKEDANG